MELNLRLSMTTSRQNVHFTFGTFVLINYVVKPFHCLDWGHWTGWLNNLAFISVSWPQDLDGRIHDAGGGPILQQRWGWGSALDGCPNRSSWDYSIITFSTTITCWGSWTIVLMLIFCGSLIIWVRLLHMMSPRFLFQFGRLGEDYSTRRYPTTVILINR